MSSEYQAGVRQEIKVESPSREHKTITPWEPGERRCDSLWRKVPQ
jgi:hypothetical protein